jgi:hypothetical protein
LVVGQVLLIQPASVVEPASVQEEEPEGQLLEEELTVGVWVKV